MGQTTTGLRRILSHPAVYEAYDAIVGTRAVRGAFVRNYVRPFPGAHILELGCGPGNVVRHLSDVHYVGVDVSEAYIQTARRRYGSRGTFIVADVDGLSGSYREAFDVVLAFGLLHHVDDVVATKVVAEARGALRAGGRFVTLDPCFADGQNRFARFLHEKDRGNHVRYPDGYLALARTAFNDVEHDLRHDLHFIPSTSFMMTCRV